MVTPSTLEGSVETEIVTWTVKKQNVGLCHHKDPSGHEFVKSTVTSASLLPHPLWNHGKHCSVLHFYNLIISRMLCKWNHTVCNLLGCFFHSASFYEDLPVVNGLFLSLLEQ